jgi:hypothetical protein
MITSLLLLLCKLYFIVEEILDLLEFNLDVLLNFLVWLEADPNILSSQDLSL